MPISKSSAPGSTGPTRPPRRLNILAPSPLRGEGEEGNPMPKVLISDKMDPRAAQIFRERGVEVD
ncbi:MAG: hypothetical protein EOP67_67675, partial [Sphingomonas sp.]